MTGLCINESRQQQIGRSAHHLESFICDCFFQRLVRLAMCAKQSTRPPRATNDTTHTTTNIKHMCAEVSKLVSRCSCLAVAPMFHRLASWERPQSSWEVHPDDVRAVWNVEQELDVPEVIGDTFADYLSTAFLKGKLSVKTVCEIAWYAHNAGAQGRVTELVYKPGASTGNYAQHLKRALGLDHETESLYTMRMPAQDKYDQNRTVMDLSIVPAHEALHREFQEQPELAFAIDAVAGSAEWTPTYYAHPVTAGSDGFVAPLALYLDAFTYIKEDAIWEITMYNL